MILYDGDQDGESLGEELKKRYPKIADRIFAFDINRGRNHDILGDLWPILVHSTNEGRILALLAGPNCKSWSILLHRTRDGFPAPKRTREDPWVAIDPNEQIERQQSLSLLRRAREGVNDLTHRVGVRVRVRVRVRMRVRVRGCIDAVARE